MRHSLANLAALLLMLPGTAHATACQAQYVAGPSSPIVAHLQILSPAVQAEITGTDLQFATRGRPAQVSSAYSSPRRVALKPSRPVRLDVRI